MPHTPHHEILVFRKTTWLSTAFDVPNNTQQWMIYQHAKRSWWTGRCPKPLCPREFQNNNLPQPAYKVYAFTEWSWDFPQSPNGTELWVPDLMVDGSYQVWYSPKPWYEVCEAEERSCQCMGNKFWQVAQSCR